jgi:hypothetical protein
VLIWMEKRRGMLGRCGTGIEESEAEEVQKMDQVKSGRKTKY